MKRKIRDRIKYNKSVSILSLDWDNQKKIESFLILNLSHKNMHSFLFSSSYKNIYFLILEGLFFLMRWDSFSTNNTLISFSLPLSYFINFTLKLMLNLKLYYTFFEDEESSMEEIALVIILENRVDLWNINIEKWLILLRLKTAFIF